MKRNKKNISDETKVRIKCHKLLKECIEFEHIEDEEFILRNIHIIEEHRKDLPADIYENIEEFIEEVISPIVYDRNYFDFTISDEFGEYNDEGHFVINSESSLEMMIFLLYEHTLELQERLNDFAFNQLYQF